MLGKEDSKLQTYNACQNRTIVKKNLVFTLEITMISN